MADRLNEGSCGTTFQQGISLQANPVEEHDMPQPHPEHPHLSHAEYFALEQAEELRYEYFQGEVYAMTGGTERHALIAMNTGVALSNALRDRPCRVYGADMKLHIAPLEKFCYPDVLVLCEEGVRHERYVENPMLIVEVLSESTESYDRGLKFEHYRTIPALRHNLLLAQDRVHGELFSRGADGIWRLFEANGPEGALNLEVWDVMLHISDAYRQVEVGA